MNRIEIKLETKPEYHLWVYNDIKGVSTELLIEATGLQAKYLYDLFTHIDYSELENYMHYGVYVDGEGYSYDEVPTLN